MNLSAADFESCASSTSSMIFPKVVSSPTLSATIRSVPFSKIVPAYTFEPGTFSTGTASPVMLASFAWPSPAWTTPSTGTFAPVFTSNTSPTSTSSTSTSSNAPAINFNAVSGAISVSSLIADLVLLKVRCSKKAPNKNRNVTIAASS